MRKPLLIAFAIILSLTACSNRPVFWLPPEIFNPDPEPVEECKHINLKEVTEYFDPLSEHYPKTGICTECGEKITRDSIEIGTADQLLTLGEDLSANNDIGWYTISIIDDIDMTGKTWPFIKLDGYNAEHYYGRDFVINGNGNTIKNLSTGDESSTDSQGFIAYVWSAVTLKIQNLTLDNASITASKTAPANGAGGFIGYIDSSASVILDGCNLIGDSTITGGHWAGGIYGYAAGHDDVKTVVKINNCTVKNATITSTNASVGGIMGHAGGNANTEINVSNSSVTGCTIISTENKQEDGIKAGHILGTNGVGDTVLDNVTFNNNTVKSNDTKVDEAYGRLKFQGVGSLTIGTDEIQES